MQNILRGVSCICSAVIADAFSGTFLMNICPLQNIVTAPLESDVVMS